MSCPRVFNHIHPNEKPVKLLTWLINNSTKEGELVLDPFMGSGATCLAAKNSKRKYLGIEIDPEWYKKAQERMA
jgi:site-specific DNA-methyltransferase (adenine-specific)